MKTLQVPDDLDGAHLVKWLKADGDAFVAGEPLVTFALDGVETQVTADRAGVLARIMARPPDDSVTFGGGAAIAILAEPGEDIGYHAGTVRTVRVKVRRTCSACGNDYPVNGFVQKMACPSCRVVETAPPGFWSSYLFEDVVEALDKGTSTGGTVIAGQYGACSRQCSSLLPLCRKCYQLLGWNLFAPVWAAAQAGSPGELACGGCGEVYPVRAAPEWARLVQPGLLGMVGELGVDAPTVAPTSKPVMFTCPQCAAPLKVDGAKRIVTCGHCNVDVRLPDDLWAHFNPVPKWESWWLLFDPAVPGPSPPGEDEWATAFAEPATPSSEEVVVGPAPTVSPIRAAAQGIVIALVIAGAFIAWLYVQ